MKNKNKFILPVMAVAVASQGLVGLAENVQENNEEIVIPNIDVLLAVAETVKNMDNFEEDLLNELKKLDVDTSTLNIKAVKTSETSTNSENAVDIFNEWEMFPYNYTGTTLWKYSASDKSITSPVDTGFETGFLNMDEGMFSKYTMESDITYKDINGDPLGFLFGVNKVPNTEHVYNMYYLWFAKSHTGLSTVTLFKVENQNFDYKNRLTDSLSRYAATPLKVLNENAFGFSTNGYDRQNMGGFPYNTPKTPGTTVTNIWDSNMKTTVLATKDLNLKQIGTHNFKLDVEGNNFKFYINDEEAISYVDINKPFTEGYMGLFQYSSPNAIFKNLNISTEKTMSYLDIENFKDWSEDSEKILVFSDNTSNEYFRDSNNLNKLTKKIADENLHFISYGTEENDDLMGNLLETANKGLNLDYNDYQNSVQETALYIKSILDKATDITPPSKPIINLSTEGLTNQDVTTSVDYSEDSEVKLVRYNGLVDAEKETYTDKAGQIWNLYEGDYTFTENGYIEAMSLDKAGNESEISKQIINNIDKENTDNVNILADTNSPTNKDVLVTLTSEQGEEIYYSVNDGEFIKYENPVIFEDNGHIKAYSIDKAGNLSEIKEYTVDNIDKIAPDTPEINQEVTENTNKPYGLQLLNQEDSANTLYKFNDNDWVILDSNVLNISQNGEYSFKYIDQAGNESEIKTLNIDNFDTENLDNITITPNITTHTNKNVEVTITSELDEELYYSVNDGEFIKYENPVVFEENGIIKSYSLDIAGNVSETKEYNVSNIDKIAPDAPIVEQEVTELTNKTYGLKLLNQEAEVDTLYKFNDNDWVSLDGNVLNISQNGEYSFKYIDQAGNESEITTLNVTNFDYDAEDFYLTKEEFNTHGDIFVNLSEDFNDDIYMLLNGEYIQIENNKVQVYENGTYTFKCVDELGNEVIKDIEVNLVNIIPTIDNLDYDTVTNTPSVVDKLVENIENPKLDTPKDDEYYEYLLNHLAGLGQDELDKIKGSGVPVIDDVYKFSTSGVLSSSDQILSGSGGFNAIYKLINELPSVTGNNTLIDLGSGYLVFMEDCGEDYIGDLTIEDILDGNSSPEYMKIINYIDCIPDEDTQNRLRDKLKGQVIKLIEDCLDDPTGSGVGLKELAELGNSFGVLDSSGNFGTGGDSGGNFGSGSSSYIGGLIGGLTPDTLSTTGGQIIDYLNCGCVYIPDEDLDRLKKEFDDKITEIFNNELDKAKLNPTDDEGLEPLIQIIKCGCMPKETEDYLTGLLEEYLKELISNSGSLQELDKIEQFTEENGFDLTEEIEEKRREFGLVESGGGTDIPDEPAEEPTEEDNEQPEITETENIETDIVIPSDNGTNTNSNQVEENNKDLPQTGTEQGANAGIVLLVTGLLGGLLVRRKQNKTE